MIKKITYLTYQNFPANTANSIQTLKTFKYLSRYKFESELIFPLREKNSSDNIGILQDHYGFNDRLILCLMLFSVSMLCLERNIAVRLYCCG